jgi:hypothetical protein
MPTTITPIAFQQYQQQQQQQQKWHAPSMHSQKARAHSAHLAGR